MNSVLPGISYCSFMIDGVTPSVLFPVTVLFPAELIFPVPWKAISLLVITLYERLIKVLKH